MTCILVVDDEHQIAQSTSIMRFLQKIARLEPEDPIVAAKAYAISENAQQLSRPLNPTVNFAVGEDFESKIESMILDLSSRFADLERALMEDRKRFFIGDEPIACDLKAYHHLDLSRQLDPNLLENFIRLTKFVSEIEGVESVSNYLQARTVD